MVVNTGMCVEVETDIIQQTLTYDRGSMCQIYYAIRSDKCLTFDEDDSRALLISVAPRPSLPTSSLVTRCSQPPSFFPSLGVSDFETRVDLAYT